LCEIELGVKESIVSGAEPPSASPHFIPDDLAKGHGLSPSCHLQLLCFERVPAPGLPQPLFPSCRLHLAVIVLEVVVPLLRGYGEKTFQSPALHSTSG
jgi:hypothetical protein